VNLLDTLHRKNLLPGFDDREDNESSIDECTKQLTLIFKNTQKQIRIYEDKNSESITGNSNLTKSNQEKKLHQNVVCSLASKLSHLSGEFRKSQSNYLASTLRIYMFDIIMSLL
jgi:syntaxin 16